MRHQRALWSIANTPAVAPGILEHNPANIYLSIKYQPIQYFPANITIPSPPAANNRCNRQPKPHCKGTVLLNSTYSTVTQSGPHHHPQHHSMDWQHHTDKRAARYHLHIYSRHHGNHTTTTPHHLHRNGCIRPHKGYQQATSPRHAAPPPAVRPAISSAHQAQAP